MWPTDDIRTADGRSVRRLPLTEPGEHVKDLLATAKAIMQACGHTVGYVLPLAGVRGGYALYAASGNAWHQRVADVYPSGVMDMYSRLEED